MPSTIWYLYILKCEGNYFYTGISSTPKTRFFYHKNGKGSCFTRQHPPIKLVYTEKCNSYIEARKREQQIKGWSHKKKENLINYGHPTKRHKK